jgi:hypothetical protein
VIVTFIDERWKPLPEGKRVIVSCCVFRRDRWDTVNAITAAVGAVRKKRRLAEIQRVLEAAAGFGVVTHADIPNALMPPGEIDGTLDVPAMSRMDNLWSITVSVAVVTAMAYIQVSAGTLDVVELFYDPKDLTAAHRAGFESVLSTTLPEIAEEVVAHFGATHGITAGNLRFLCIQQVPKPCAGDDLSPAQRGTNLAHHLCAQSGPILGAGLIDRIVGRDATSAVTDMMKVFQAAGERSRAT